MAIPNPALDPDLAAAIAVTRFGLGARPGELAAARSDPRGYLKRQIRPEGADQPQGDLGASADLLTRYVQMRKGDRQNLRDAVRWGRERMLDECEARATLQVATPAGFRERWTQFWANHFTVSTTKAQVMPIAGAFEREAIRPHVFGRFEDMVMASTHHPAMLAYLDNVQSVGPDSPAGQRRQRGLNENLGREVMELHTLGVDAGYTQTDVTEFARALTGWRTGLFENPPAGDFEFRPEVHEPGPRKVFGKTYPDTGEGQARAILVDLARNPATARHIATKLAIHFVADTPPKSLVDRLAQAFDRSGGRLDVVAETLIDDPEAWTPDAAKLKSPNDFLISAYRSIGVPPTNPRNFAGMLQLLGQRPYSPPSPKGWPDQSADWAAPGAIVTRMAWAERFGAAVGNRVDPLKLADSALGARLIPATATAIRRAESRPEAVALLLMSPEFQRR